jgi:phosphonate transport system substrate-binding protein
LVALHRWLVALLVLAAAGSSPLRAATADDPHVLVLGRISDDPKAHYEQLKPLLDYIVPRMADVGIREGRILMARDAQQMNSYLRRGRVDWVTETAGTAMLLANGSGARPLLLTERDGVSRYTTVFFARRDSGIRSLADLRGRAVAFQNPYSTSAYYVPATEILDAGLKLEILLSPADRPTPGGPVGYLFARTELNIATWVHKRLGDVGAMSNLDPKVEARLREVLLQAASDPDAREALLQFFKTTRFLPIDAKSQHALQYIGAGVQRLRAEVE